MWSYYRHLRAFKVIYLLNCKWLLIFFFLPCRSFGVFQLRGHRIQGVQVQVKVSKGLLPKKHFVGNTNFLTSVCDVCVWGLKTSRLKSCHIGHVKSSTYPEDFWDAWFPWTKQFLFWHFQGSYDFISSMRFSSRCFTILREEGDFNKCCISIWRKHYLRIVCTAV